MKTMEDKGVPLNSGNIMFDPVVNVEQLLTQISEVDLVISPRFHNIIYGVMLNKPVISLSYHQKFAPLMNDLGLEGNCQDLSDLDVDLLKRQIVDLTADDGRLMGVVAQKKERYRSRLKEQYMRIFDPDPGRGE